MLSLKHQLIWGASEAFRTIVPEPQHRIPIKWSTAVYPVLCYAPFVFLAYLTRRPDTYTIRLLMLPSVITSILVAAYRFTWTIPELNVYNWGQCLFAAVAIAKSLEFALNKEGMLKVGESRPGVKKGKAKDTLNGTVNGYAIESAGHPYVATWFYDAMEVAHTLRGLQWKFGQGVHIPKHTRPLERSAFLKATLDSFIKNFLVLDFLESLLKLFPGVGEPLGGSMFYPELAPVARYTVSTIIHLLTGSALLSGFGMVYDLITLIAVGLMDGSPLSWPPVMENPWISESMHEFWAKRWHQLLRQTFLVFGGYPGKWLAGNVGMLFGAFIASGLFHECAMYSMGRGFDHFPTLFFAMQGPILIIERLWRRFTGKKVGGWPGRLWVYFDMFILAQPMINAWHRRGLGGGLVIPPILSPTRLIVLPLVKSILHLIQS
ncbi:hypothetical protein JR316_0007242 [Psilocybe cubensis]|uniref:Wax synthase domain-containing protein n=2 Tax=Psilocybe cubensis TaxID=181762 RepID=A0A8H8CH11_PSICU|nr:hypothetical protein JR316_0007242 [Psilocybe cubensis]KAH9480642.1 hypothetical protein JR316_0007242 [Psilocybe cubensis]